MAGALQPALVDGGRIRRLKDGSYIDSATGKRYASFKDIPNNGMNPVDQPGGNPFTAVGGALASGAKAIGNVLTMPVRPSASNPPNLTGALSGAIGQMGQTGDAENPTAMTPPRPAAAAPQGALGGGADVRSPIPMQLPTLAPPEPLAASSAGGGADSTSPIPMILPTTRAAQAAHDPGAAGAYAPTPDTQQAPVIGDDGNDMLSPSLASGAVALKGALGKVPGPVNITPSVGGAFDSSRAPSDFSNAGAATDAANRASFGALGNGFQPKPLDVTSGLAAMSQKNAPALLTHDPSWMERVGGALGLREAGPSTSGSGAFDGLFDDPDRRRMLEMGLGTMAAAGQPGATLGGALGQGGLGALRSEDIRQERTDKTKEEQRRLDTEMARYDADRQERRAFHQDENQHWTDTNTRETGRDKAAAAQAVVQNNFTQQEITARGDAEKAREASDTKLRDIENRRLNNDTTREGREAQTSHDKGFSDAYDNYLKSQKTNSTSSLDALINPKDATRLDQDAKWNAAVQFPRATQSKAVAQQTILDINATMKKNGGVMPPELRAKNNQAKAILQGGK